MSRTHITNRSPWRCFNTYDDSPEVRQFAEAHAFYPHRVAMKNTHHNELSELAITNFPMSTRLPAAPLPEILLCEKTPTVTRRRARSSV